MRITVENRGPDAAALHLLPTLWFRNTWSWGADVNGGRAPDATTDGRQHDDRGVASESRRPLPARRRLRRGAVHRERDQHRAARRMPEPDALRQGRLPCLRRRTGAATAVNPEHTGTKAAAHYALTVPGGGRAVVRLRLSSRRRRAPASDAGRTSTPSSRRGGARPTSSTRPSCRRRSMPDAANVMRQALAGMLWSKQFYNYDVDRWLGERGADPFKARRRRGAAQRPLASHAQRRHHLDAGQVGVPVVRRLGSGVPRARADARGPRLRQAAARSDAAGTLSPSERADSRLRVELRRRQPAGARLVDDLHLPARPGATRPAATSTGSSARSTSCCSTSRGGSTARTATATTSSRAASSGSTTSACSIAARRCRPGGYLEQADGTAWMALFCQNMLEIAAELALESPAYVDMGLKFVEHFLWIASSLVHAGEDIGMWDEEDGFFYDVLRLPDGHAQRLKVRSMVGLLPLCAVTVFEGKLAEKYPEIVPRMRAFIDGRPELRAFIHDPTKRGEHAGCSPRCSTSTSCAVCSRACSTRTSSSARTASARSRSTTRSIRTSFARRTRNSVSATCRRSPTAACSAAIRTGAARSGCRSTA